MQTHRNMTKHMSFIMCIVITVSLLAMPNSSAEAVAVTRAKIKTLTAKLYKSTKPNSTYAVLKKGSVVTVVSEHGKWIKAKTKGKSGYILRTSVEILDGVKKPSSTTTPKPTAKPTVTPKPTLKAKATSKDTYRALKAGNSGEAVKKLQNRLSNKGYLSNSRVNGKYDSYTTKAVREFQIFNSLTINGQASIATQKRLFSSSAKDKPKVSIEPWGSSGINSRFRNRTCAVIIDMSTGIRINIRRVYGSNHCDVEPKTLADTKKLKAVYGGKWSWNSRGVLLIAGGKYFAAAINGYPHGEEISTTNGFKGQFCLHLKDSHTHGTNKENAAHQANIQKVYNYFS